MTYREWMNVILEGNTYAETVAQSKLTLTNFDSWVQAKGTELESKGYQLDSGWGQVLSDLNRAVYCLGKN